jgi:hypothetical protein
MLTSHNKNKNTGKNITSQGLYRPLSKDNYEYSYERNYEMQSNNDKILLQVNIFEKFLLKFNEAFDFQFAHEGFKGFWYANEDAQKGMLRMFLGQKLCLLFLLTRLPKFLFHLMCISSCMRPCLLWHQRHILPI